MSVDYRIIPCLDIQEGRVVKGVNFENMRDSGDPIDVARRYEQEGADELTFLDISATPSGKDTLLHVVTAVAECIFIPLTVGGGVRCVADVERLLHHGADKVSLNSAALANPQIIADCAAQFGSQCIVVAIDVKRDGDHWRVFSHGGRRPTGVDAIEWVAEVSELGAGELLITSIDADGTRDGYDIALYDAVAKATSTPIIASGGAGGMAHLWQMLRQQTVDAVLAASIFHDEQVSIRDVKEYLTGKGIDRITPVHSYD